MTPQPAGSACTPQPKRTTLGLFGRVAATYDHAGFLHQAAGRVIAHAQVPTGARVLDIATGTGAVLLEAARLTGPTGLLVGCDLAEPMVTQAARRLRALDRARWAVAVMDAEQLGFRPATFDVVCCASAIYLLGDQAAAVRSWLDLLRPDGTLAISEFGDLDARWAWKAELLNRLAPPLEPLGSGHMDAAALEGLVQVAGGRDARVRVERLDVVYPSAAAWWAAEWTHGERRVLEAMTAEALTTYRQAAFAAIETCREGDGALHWRPQVVVAVASR